MGLCKISNFSIFNFINASDLKFLHTFLLQVVQNKYVQDNRQHVSIVTRMNTDVLETMFIVNWFLSGLNGIAVCYLERLLQTAS